MKNREKNPNNQEEENVSNTDEKPVFNTDKIVEDVAQRPELLEYFDCDSEKFKLAIQKAIDKIFATVESPDDQDAIASLLESFTSHLVEKQNTRDTEFVHGAGTFALKGIIEDAQIIRRGKGVGGADVEMGHEISDTEEGKKETYISVSMNSDVGYAISYAYARGFERPETKQDLLLDSNKINGTNVHLEVFRGMSAEEKKDFQEKYPHITEEFIAQVSERPHYFDPVIEKEKTFIYQEVIDRLNLEGVVPDSPMGTTNVGEIQHLIGKVNNNEVLNTIFASLKKEIETYPDTEISRIVVRYQAMLDRTKERLGQYESLDEDERKSWTHQHPVMFGIKKPGVKDLKIRDKNADGQDIQPFGQERRIYDDIDLMAISTIEVPQAMIPEVKKMLEQKVATISDAILIEHISKIKISPLEYYEIERVIKDQVRELQE